MKKKFRILILYDDLALSQPVAEQVAGAGYSVDSLAMGSLSPDQVARTSSDLILLVIGGVSHRALEVLDSLHRHSATRHIPIMALSGSAELEYELLDIFDFLTFPIDYRRLLDGIDQLYRGRHGGSVKTFGELGDAGLKLFQSFLILHSGLHFDQRNSKLLERGLHRRMRAVRAWDYSEYFHYLQTFYESRRELQKLLSLLTVGETFFFRYRAHFEALQNDVIPEIIRRKAAERTLRIWSAGCSTGEEPYSLAILLREHFPQLSDWKVSILGTDINYRSLRQAREAIYNPRALRVLDPIYRNKYFRARDNRYILVPSIRDMVRFAHLNLQTCSYPSVENGTAGIDILFCRNVMIYFGLPTTRRIIKRFSRCLNPEGAMFLGHSETLTSVSRDFNAVHAHGGFYFRLRPPGESAAAIFEVREDQGETVAVERPEPAPAPGGVPAPVPEIPTPSQGGEPPPEADLVALLEEGDQAFLRERFDVAADAYQTILSRQPDHVRALVGMGFIEANRGDYREAFEYGERALAVDDLCVEAYFLQGMILELGDDYDGAIAEYRKALLLDLNFIMPHYNLSRIYRRQGQYPEARRALRNVLRLLEKAADEEIIPLSGGLSRAVFLEVCREDSDRLAADG